MWEYLVGVAKERRLAPADDLVSVLADGRNGRGQRGAGRQRGDRLSEAELAMFLIQLLVAGNETTRNLLSGGLVALAERPDSGRACGLTGAAARRRRGAAALDDAGHLVHADGHGATTVRGVDIAEGDPVLLLYASANRDEEVFGPDAGRLRVDRQPNPHVSFGFGPHFCLGAALARLEGRVVLGELVDRFEVLELAGPVERTASPVIAGVRRAELVFRPGPARA